ncbi:MAG: ligase-associated DNA damage response DEXH box helicase [Saprospiraceae bacterium]|nr:ligase-associated DNA damage response DEXH box helicase [Saprospiraceae bacterium]
MKEAPHNKGLQAVEEWFNRLDWEILDFQKQAWLSYLNGDSGIVNAPTGSGKTYSILLGILIKHLSSGNINEKNLKIIWVTPIRALAKEILISCQRALIALQMDWKVEIRTGDTDANTRKQQFSKPPQIMITTPESLHVILSTKGHLNLLSDVDTIVVDEWHELMGSKRGTQMELFINYMYHRVPHLQIWGISATIGNMEEAMSVLLFPIPTSKRKLIQSNIHKKITVQSIIPSKIDLLPWAGHLGLKLIDDVVKIIQASESTLIFTNTRAQCEIWYQKLIDFYPDFSGIIAMHHGSISREIRDWVEEALYVGRLKAVVCTSSLDLGVDFRPVDAVIQIGSPKGVARFLQRAGRSGHSPGAKSNIYFLPTHALELVESAGLRIALEDQSLEERIPYIRSFDVLTQFLMTLSVSDGFFPDTLYQEILNTFCFQSITDEEWRLILNSLVYGDQSLQAYDEYKRVEILPDGMYKVLDRKMIQRHKLSIGTIVSDVMMQIRFVKGGYIGSIEEIFISQLLPGDSFWFAGRALELVRVKEMVAQVKPSSDNKGRIPSYSGGRMPLSSQMSKVLKQKLFDYRNGIIQDDEMHALQPLLSLQQERSIIPAEGEFLIEYLESNEGYHILMYPFEGRNVHEGLGALLAKRISMKMPVSFSIAMNDLGFELLTDIPLKIDTLITKELFSTENLVSDIQSCVNSVEMSRRRFRDIAKISGLIFGGFPNKLKKERHLQSSSQLIFDVFQEYEPENLLLRQANEEVMTFQLEEERMYRCLKNIQNSTIRIIKPKTYTPFSFPIIVDRLREKLTSEKLEDRIKKMSV